MFHGLVKKLRSQNFAHKKCTDKLFRSIWDLLSFSILAPICCGVVGKLFNLSPFPLIYQILSKSNVYYFCQALGGRINFSPISGLKHICWMVFGYKVKGLWPFPPIFSMEFVKKNDETFPECPKCKILLTITKSGNFVNILSKNLLLHRKEKY